jgi:hypothetical protein
MSDTLHGEIGNKETWPWLLVSEKKSEGRTNRADHEGEQQEVLSHAR